jgi:hypothetical protein
MTFTDPRCGPGMFTVPIDVDCFPAPLAGNRGLMSAVDSSFFALGLTGRSNVQSWEDIQKSPN